MKKYEFTEISQKVFNRNKRRIVNQAINEWNITDNKTMKIIEEYFSIKLNDLITKNPNIILDKVQVEL